jgi:bacillaene synthase trans-acting acyltransferase
MIIFMYSGQGSQYYHMGAELYASNEIFRETIDDMDRTVATRLGHSVVDSMYAPERRRTDHFEHAVISSLAIFMVERALTETLLHDNCKPDQILSVSMGSFAAVCSGQGIVDQDEMLEAVVRYGEVLEQTCPEGTMCAVLGSVAVHGSHPELAQNSEVAALNSDSHFVISLLRSELLRIETFFSNQKVACRGMPVARAYHSRWIEPAHEKFLSVFDRLSYQRSRIPIHFCSMDSSTTSVSAETLWNTIRRPIRFRDVVQSLEQDGPHHYIDVGPSGTLATILKHVLPVESRSDVLPILTPFNRCDRNLEKVLTL